LAEAKHYLTEQLHRVASERDEERRLRLESIESLDAILEALDNEEE